MPCGADVLCVDVEDESVRAQFEALLDRLPQLVLESRPAVENGKGAAVVGNTSDAVHVESSCHHFAQLVHVCPRCHVFYGFNSCTRA